MAKLQDMFTQARRAQSGGGMGFLGKNKAETKTRAAALVVELSQITAGSAEAALKAGADGLIFTWNGTDTSHFETLKQEIEAATANNKNTVTGLNIQGGWDTLDQDSLKHLKEVGVQYIILPFNAPARLLALAQDLEKVIITPMRKDEMYPIYIRNLTAFDGISAVVLDFNLNDKLGSMSIEEILDYRAVREGVRFASFIYANGNLGETDAYTLKTLDVQALILAANDVEENTREQIKNLRELLEKVHQDDKDNDKDAPSTLGVNRK